MTGAEKEKIADKVRKLLAKARGNENEAEAAAFAAKAHQMIVDHDLQGVLDAEAGETVTAEPLGTNSFVWKNDFPWSRVLANQVCLYYMCGYYRARFEGVSTVVYVFVGKKHRAEVAESMFRYLYKTVIRMSNDAYETEAERRRYREGAGWRLAVRLRELREAAAATSDSRALAIFDSAAAEIAAALSGLEEKNPRAPKSTRATMRGYVDADSVQLNEQLRAASEDKDAGREIGAPALRVEHRR